MGGGLGSADPVIIYRRSGGLAGTMPASWRGDCHDAGGIVPDGNPGSSQRDSAAAVMQTTPHCA